MNYQNECAKEAAAGRALDAVTMRGTYSDVRGTAVPIGAVPAAVEQLDKSVSYLHERVGLLLQRLSAVTTPEPPQPVAEDRGQKLARHSLALQITAGAVGVESAARVIDSLLSRLEV